MSKHEVAHDSVGAGGTDTPSTVDESQKRRLVTATADLVAERGYATATIDAITGAAGVSKKTFYKFFPSKEEAFLTAYEAHEVVLRRVTEAAAGEGTTDAVFDTMIGHYLTALATAPSLTRLFLIEAMGATPRILQQRARGIDVFVAGVQGLLEAARKDDPAVPTLSDAHVRGLLGGINELCVYHITWHSIDTLPTLHRTIRTFSERFLRP